ncbi:MAG TPA: glycosyl hydrolase family 65 protein [Micromonosporaceae bacterium]
MSAERLYPVEPWCVREPRLDLNRLAQSESVLAVANGHIGLRANLDEGEPHAMPGTYVNSFYEVRPLPYAEPGYGFPESGQAVINVTNGKPLRLLVNDEPFDVRYGELRSHERVLDLREGTLRRSLEWVSPAGEAVRVRSTRLVSFTHRAVAAIEYEVEPVGRAARIIVQSELVANEQLPASRPDPRVAAALESPLAAEEHIVGDTGGLLVHCTRGSGLRVAAGMDHVFAGPAETGVTAEAHPDWARTTFACSLRPGESLRIVKFIGYGWSSQRSRPALRDQVHAALAGARFTGWDGLARSQREYLDAFWDSADVEIDGDAEIQQAVRVGLFHVLQAGARAERRPMAAKGLTGPGYDGHVFWDMEMFVLPVLTYTLPSATADALRWRHSTLDLARQRARTLNLAGAAFPWRTVRGQECSGYWPAGTASFHVNADIADAVLRYVGATRDDDFMREVGLELLVETARLWRSLGHHDRLGRFHVDGVTGPDEYSALGDDNIYTNLMAQRNLSGAADAAIRHPDEARALGVDQEDAAAWRDAANAMHLPYDDQLGVHQQAQRFTDYREWDFPSTGRDQYPLLLHFPYYQLYDSQVIKQADLVLAMHWRGDAFSAEAKARNFAYCEPRTARDSSLSSCTQAVLAAEVGHLELAHDYLAESALVDLEDLASNAGDGVHLAALAGGWLALVAGFGGMRDHDGQLAFAPRLPSRVNRLSFSLRWHGHRLRVTVSDDEATYALRDAEDDGMVELVHHGERLTVTADERVSRPIPPAPAAGAAPQQPPGRAPRRRGEG